MLLLGWYFFFHLYQHELLFAEIEYMQRRVMLCFTFPHRKVPLAIVALSKNICFVHVQEEEFQNDNLYLRAKVTQFRFPILKKRIINSSWLQK